MSDSTTAVTVSFPTGTILCAIFCFLKLLEVGVFTTASWWWAPVLFVAPFAISMTIVLSIMAVVFLIALIASLLDK